ncbi:MAG: glucose-1-phosphate thymidylyltransferase [Microgenomates group bacterium]|jgi:glucose-1-phosphate thymidylyltransferase
MKAIIPTGGRGTRMQPLTFSSNKHFLPIANKPLIFFPIETVAEAGIKEVAITYDAAYLDQAKSVLGDGSRWGLKFTYVLQEKPLGLANIFQICEEYLDGESFFLHLGDNIFVDGIKKFVTHFEKNKPNALVPMVHHEENRRLGVPFFDKNGRLIQYVEKPENPPHDFAIPGLYFFDNNVFKCFKGEDQIKPSPRGELEISAPFQWLIDHKYQVDVLEYEGKWLDPGKFDDWIETNQYMVEYLVKDNEIESEYGSDVSVDGNIKVGRGCTIERSKIKGPVIIGDNVIIRDSFIGPYSAISDGCEIEGSEVENSEIMEKVKIKKFPGLIDSSLIGPESELIDGEKEKKTTSFFIGAKSKIIV